MFHKASTEAERQKIFDDYILSILKQKQVVKKNKKIIDEQEFSYDPTMDEDKVKGAFNSYVDSLVVKNFLIEQLYTRLKINKNMALNFVNKLDGNQVLILSKVINEFIQDIQDKYVSINDYILKTSFDELQGNYNVIQQQEKDNEIVKQNQVEQGQVLQENIPAEELVEDEEQGTTEEKKMSDFLKNTIFKLEGVRNFSNIDFKKTILGVFLDEERPNALKPLKMSNKTLNELFEEELFMVLRNADENEKKTRQQIQERLIQILRSSKFIPDEVRTKNKNLKILSVMEGLMVGSGYGIQFPVSKNQDEYISIGKYKAHKTKLMGGKLQMRSNNNNQIHNLKSQNITKNIRDILLKLNKDETINFSDVDKLNTDEKDQLYMIGKKLHITQLFDIPSTLKSQEDKLKDEFQLLRGSLIAGNNNPDLLRKFKIVLLKMKNKKLISLQEYNEVLNILLEMEI
jgi:hypothetical protein